jgi:hypothetical protein
MNWLSSYRTNVGLISIERYRLGLTWTFLVFSLALVWGCGGSVTGPSDGPDAAAAPDTSSFDGTVDATMDTSSSDDAVSCLSCGADSSTPVGKDAGPCGPLTCPTGCCDSSGRCQVPTPSACGGSGSACVACAPGSSCKGACITPQVHCDSTNCTGCCAGPNWCSPGTSDYACGVGGQDCQSCVPSQDAGGCVAVDGGGLCNGVISCDSSNCQGCCDGNVCQTGAYNAQCGSNGVACEACPAGQECAPVQSGMGGNSCQATSVCTIESCPNGCCANDICAVGTQDLACGMGGQGCVDCTMNTPPGTCVNRTCQ